MTCKGKKGHGWLANSKNSNFHVQENKRFVCLRKWQMHQVGNFWFLYPLVLSKWEDLAFSVCIIFEESVFIFQFLNDKMHNYVLFNTFVHFIIQKLKNKHTFLKTEKAKFSQRENLVFSVLRKVCLLFNFLMLKFLVMFCLT